MHLYVCTINYAPTHLDKFLYMELNPTEPGYKPASDLPDDPAIFITPRNVFPIDTQP